MELQILTKSQTACDSDYDIEQTFESISITRNVQKILIYRRSSVFKKTCGSWTKVYATLDYLRRKITMLRWHLAYVSRITSSKRILASLHENLICYRARSVISSTPFVSLQPLYTLRRGNQSAVTGRYGSFGKAISR